MIDFVFVPDKRGAKKNPANREVQCGGGVF
jgi:hypothetical protein